MSPICVHVCVCARALKVPRFTHKQLDQQEFTSNTLFYYVDTVTRAMSSIDHRFHNERVCFVCLLLLLSQH